MQSSQFLEEGSKLALFGAGGLARELASSLLRKGVKSERMCFVVDEPYYSESFIWNGLSMRRSSEGLEGVIVALGDQKSRRIIADRAGGWKELGSLNLGIVGHGVSVGYGSVIAEGARVTSDISIGDGTLIQMDSTVAHDCIIGDEVNVNPGARINGGVTIGDRVLIGAQSCIREGIQIAADVTVGMGAVVVKNILEPGTYVGNPLRRIK